MVEEKHVIEGVHDVAGAMYDRIGYTTLLERKKDNQMLRDLVMARLAHPASKYNTQKILDKQFSVTHDLDISNALNHIYASDCRSIKADYFQIDRDHAVATSEN